MEVSAGVYFGCTDLSKEDNLHDKYETGNFSKILADIPKEERNRAFETEETKISKSFVNDYSGLKTDRISYMNPDAEDLECNISRNNTSVIEDATPRTRQKRHVRNISVTDVMPEIKQQAAKLDSQVFFHSFVNLIIGK